VTPDERKKTMASSLVAGHYEQTIDRESAYEKLKSAAQTRMDNAPAGKGATPTPAPQQPTASASSGGSVMDVLGGILLGTTGPRGGHREGVLEAAAKSAARAAGSQVGREILRGVLGSLVGGRRR
jgi:hypothetical protein